MEMRRRIIVHKFYLIARTAVTAWNSTQFILMDIVCKQVTSNRANCILACVERGHFEHSLIIHNLNKICKIHIHDIFYLF